MSQAATELSVTLSPELFDQLKVEAEKLGLALEWLIASLVVDTVDGPKTPGLRPIAAA